MFHLSSLQNMWPLLPLLFGLWKIAVLIIWLYTGKALLSTWDWITYRNIIVGLVNSQEPTEGDNMCRLLF